MLRLSQCEFGAVGCRVYFPSQGAIFVDQAVLHVASKTGPKRLTAAMPLVISSLSPQAMRENMFLETRYQCDLLRSVEIMEDSLIRLGQFGLQFGLEV